MSDDLKKAIQDMIEVTSKHREFMDLLFEGPKEMKLSELPVLSENAYSVAIASNNLKKAFEVESNKVHWVEIDGGGRPEYDKEVIVSDGEEWDRAFLIEPTPNNNIDSCWRIKLNNNNFARLGFHPTHWTAPLELPKDKEDKS
jgi:hypothetical protein